MKESVAVKLEIPSETFKIERERSRKPLSYDDYWWCINAVFSFGDPSTLRIEAPIFSFTFKLGRSIRSVLGSEGPAVLNDEYGSYRLAVTIKQGILRLEDSYGNGFVSVPCDKAIADLSDEFRAAAKTIERELPWHQESPDFRRILGEVEFSLQ